MVCLVCLIITDCSHDSHDSCHLGLIKYNYYALSTLVRGFIEDEKPQYISRSSRMLYRSFKSARLFVLSILSEDHARLRLYWEIQRKIWYGCRLRGYSWKLCSRQARTRSTYRLVAKCAWRAYVPAVYIRN